MCMHYIVIFRKSISRVVGNHSIRRIYKGTNQNYYRTKNQSKGRYDIGTNQKDDGQRNQSKW